MLSKQENRKYFEIDPNVQSILFNLDAILKNKSLKLSISKL